jgi:hypothetical protein
MYPSCPPSAAHLQIRIWGARTKYSASAVLYADASLTPMSGSRPASFAFATAPAHQHPARRGAAAARLRTVAPVEEGEQIQRRQARQDMQVD